MSNKNYLFFDGGSSSQKALASMDGFFHGLSVPPGAIKLSRYDCEQECDRHYPDGVGVVECGKEVWRVGEMPDVCYTAAPKASSMVPKIIAAIASIVGSRSIELELVVLLPCDEYLSRADLAKQLRRAIADARFNGVSLNVEIPAIRFHAEGSGLAAHLSGVNVACMVGHTDLSLVYYENGRVKLGKSRTFGGEGIGAIAASLGVPGGDAHIAKALATGDYNALSVSGISASAIRAGYRTRLNEYLKQTFIPKLASYSWVGVDQLVLGGGGAHQVKDAIAKLSCPVIQSEAPESLALFGEELDRLRFADIYGVASLYLRDEIELKQSKAIPNSVNALLQQALGGKDA